jgi:hypothetical protein
MNTISIRLGLLYTSFATWCEMNSLSHSDGLKWVMTTQSMQAPLEPESLPPNPRIRIKLDERLKQILACCVGTGRSVSAQESIRQIVFKHLMACRPQDQSTADAALRRQSLPPPLPHLPPLLHATSKPLVGQIEKERVQLEIRFSRSEYDALQALASTFSMSSAKFALQLVRSQLLNFRPLSREEKIELGTMNNNLLKVASLLNQIARNLNAFASDHPNNQQPNEQIDGKFIDNKALQKFAQENSELALDIKELVKSIAHRLELQNERYKITRHQWHASEHPLDQPSETERKSE